MVISFTYTIYTDRGIYLKHIKQYRMKVLK